MGANDRSRLESFLMDSGICSAEDLAKVSADTPPEELIDGLVKHGRLSADQSAVLKQFALGPWSASAEGEPRPVSGGTIAATGVPDFRNFGSAPQLIPPSERYTDRTQHAKGGMGRVIRAFDASMRREVAIKELLPEVYHLAGGEVSTLPRGVGANQDAIERFLNEARITGQLEHPAIVPVYEIGTQADGSPYYTMKLVRGQSLADAIRAAKTLPERVKLLPHFVDLCQAIAFAHTRGVIHRDIKPSNVLVGEFGETLVIDWGLAKMKANASGTPMGEGQSSVTDSGRTMMGQVLGTPIYMAPEQARGALDEIDERSDVYSLGVVLYEILAGEAPFAESKPDALLVLKQEQAPPPVQRHEKQAPPDLAAICERALNRDPEQRYQSAVELAEDVERFMSGSLVQAYQYSLSQQLARFARRHKLPLAVAAVAACLIVVIAAASYLSVVDQRDAAVAATFREADARLEAEAALGATELARADAKASEERMQRELYFSTVGLAHTHMLSGEYTRARQLLAEAPPGLRGWEWHWLLFQVHGDWWSWPSPPIIPRQVDLPPRVDWATLQVPITSYTNGRRSARLVDIGNRGTRSGQVLGMPPHQATYILPNGRGVMQFELGSTRVVNLNAFDAEVRSEIETYMPMYWRPSISRDGERALIATDYRRVGVFRTDPLAVEHEFGCETGISNALMTPSASHVVTAHQLVMASPSAPAVLTFWDARSGQTLAERMGYRAHPIAIAPDAPICALTREDGGVVLVSVESGEVLRPISGLTDAAAHIAFAEQAERLAVVDHAGRATLHDTVTGALEHTWELMDAPVALAISPTGGTVAVATMGAGLHVLTATGHRPLLGHTGRIRSLEFCPAGIQLAAVDEHDIRIWNLAAPGPTANTNTPVRTAAFSGSPLTVTGVTEDGHLAAWCAHDGQPKRDAPSLSVDSPMPLLSPRASFILLRGTESARVVRVEDGEPVFVVGGSDYLHAPAAFAPDESRLALISHETSGTPGQLIVIDLQGGIAGRQFPLRNIVTGADAYYAALAFTPDGKSIVVGHGESVTEYDAVTGEATRMARIDPMHAGFGNAAAVSPNSRLFAATGAAGSIVTKSASGEGRLIRGHAARVTAIAFDPGSERMVTGSSDGTLKVWDAASGREIMPLPTLDGPVLTLAFDETMGALLVATAGTPARVFHALGWGVDLDSHLPGLDLDEQLAQYRMMHPQLATHEARCALDAQVAALTGMGYTREDALGALAPLYPADARIAPSGCGEVGSMPANRLFLHAILALMEQEVDEARRAALLQLVVDRLEAATLNASDTSRKLLALARESLQTPAPRPSAALAVALEAEAAWPDSAFGLHELYSTISHAYAANGDWESARRALARVMDAAHPEQHLMWARIHTELGGEDGPGIACDALGAYLRVGEVTSEAAAIHASLTALSNRDLDARLERIARLISPDASQVRSLPWRANLEEALHEAGVAEGVVLAFIESAGAYESMLESQPALGRPDVLEAIEAHTIPVRVDAATAPSSWRVNRFPALVALNRAGTPILRLEPDMNPITLLLFFDDLLGVPGAIRAVDIAGPVPFDGTATEAIALGAAVAYPEPLGWGGLESPWQTALTGSIQNRIGLPGITEAIGGWAFVAHMGVRADSPVDVRFRSTSITPIHILLNGERLEGYGVSQGLDSEPILYFPATLQAGDNRIVLVVHAAGEPPWFEFAVQSPSGGEVDGLVMQPVLNESPLDSPPAVALLASTESVPEATEIHLNKDEVLTEWRTNNIQFVQNARFDFVELDTGGLGIHFHNASDFAIARRVGLRDGDIIASINGVTLNDAGGLLEMYEKFDGQVIPEWNITVLRGGREVNITLHVQY